MKQTIICGLYEGVYPCTLMLKNRRLLGHYSKVCLENKFTFYFLQNKFLSLDIVQYLQNVMMKLLLVVSQCFLCEDPGNIST